MTIKEAVKGNGTALGIMACSGMIKKAETMLVDNENIEFACVYNVYNISNDEKLKVNTSIKTRNRTPGVTVLTNKRVFFCSSILGNVDSKQIRIEDIQSVDYKTMLGMATIRIKGITDMIIIEATKKTAENMLKKINNLQSTERKNESTIIETISSADEIMKYKQLLDNGAITQKEFDKKKQELLK